MTTLAAAIINTPSLDGLRLRGRAYEFLTASEVDPREAVGPFLAAVRSDRALLFELLGYEAVRDRALEYLEAAAADMRHETEGGDARPDSERHCISRSSPSTASSDGDDAQLNPERHGMPSSSPSGLEEAHLEHDRQRWPRSSASDGDEAPTTLDRHRTDRLSPPETPAPIPLPKRGPAELRDIKAQSPRSAFDSILLRDSRPIGDLQWSAIDRFISANTYEAALLRQVKAYNPPADPNELIRNVVPLEEFNRMAQRAAEEGSQ